MGLRRVVELPPSEELFRDKRGQIVPEKQDVPLCRERYGRWVPGQDTAMVIEALAAQVIDGHITYDEGYELAKDAFNPNQGWVKQSANSRGGTERMIQKEWRSTMMRLRLKEQALAK